MTMKRMKERWQKRQKCCYISSLCCTCCGYLSFLLLSTLSHCHCRSLYVLLFTLPLSIVLAATVVLHQCTASAIVFVNEKDDEYDCIGSTLKEFFGLISNQVRPDLTKGNNGHWQAWNLQCQWAGNAGYLEADNHR